MGFFDELFDNKKKNKDGSYDKRTNKGSSRTTAQKSGDKKKKKKNGSFWGF